MLHWRRGVVHPALAELLIILLCFASAVSFTAAGNVGVNYGMLANNLPSPLEVAQMLLATPLRNVKLYTADQATLQAFAHAGLKVAVGVPNEEILLLASNVTSAQSWVQNNVVAYMPATQFNYIIVGNEVLTVSPELSSSLVPAMTNLHTALVNLQLAGELKISTPHNLAVLGPNSFPPSVGTFNSNVSTTMQTVLAFLSQTNSSFMVNAYPYFAYIANPITISLDFATFQQPLNGTAAGIITDINTGLQYMNLLDAQLDSVFSAMERLGYHDIPITVSETGWPSNGDPDEIGWGIANAQTYNGNLIKHINSNVGTPLRPGASIDAFIFALFNEDLKPGPTTERNFGLFNPDEIAVYDVGLLETVGTAPVFPGSPSSPPIENSSPPAVPIPPGWSAPSYNPPYSVGAAPQPTPVYFYPPPAPSVPNAYPAPVAFAPTVPTAPPWTTTTPNAPAYGPPTPPAPTATAPVYGPPTTPLTPLAPIVQTPPHTKTWCVAKPGADVQDLSNALNYACGQGAANCVPIQPGNQCYEPNTLASHATYAFNSYYQLNGGNYWNCYFGDTGIISITDPSYDGCAFP
ncbi:hypothetical protein BDL97_13G045400 [Sphagnum fallax]|nr:hypothetical protein BDL97_13G045400 [Sphagnum fallax]